MADAPTDDAPPPRPPRPPPPRRPTLVVTDAAPPPPEPRVVIDGSARGTYTAPSESPIATSVSGSPAVTQWVVHQDIEGNRTYLGRLATHATQENLIARFAMAMPLPGQIGFYILRGITPDGRETKTEIPYRISGNSPEVIAARAALGGGGGPGPAAAAPANIEALLAPLREELRKGAEQTALERRQLADERLQAERDRATQAREDANERIERIKAESAANLAREVRLREQDRLDAEARYKADAADRERRDKREADERADRERERDKRDAAERDREREHQERLVKLTAATSLESTLGKLPVILGAMGLKPEKLIERFTDKLFGEGGEGGESTTALVVGVAGKLLEKVGDLAETQMRINAGLPPRGAPAEPETETPADPPPKQLAPPKGTFVPAPPAPPTPDPALAAVPIATQRKAREVLRVLAAELPRLPEDKRQARVLASVTPELIAFVKIVGVKKALMEAGVSDEDATKIAAMIPAGAL